MKKIRIILATVVIVLSIGGALATRPAAGNCAFQQQYRMVGGVWTPVGTYGMDYVCGNFPDWCTFYRPSPFFQPNYYVPCRQGEYVLIDH